MVGREFLLATVLEIDILETHQLALIFLQAFRCVRNLCERVHDERVEVGHYRHTVKLCLCGESLDAHEAHLVGFAVFIPGFPAHLLQTGIFADCHAGHIHHNLLPAAVVEIEVVGVDGEGQRRCLVLDHEAFEHVSFFVGGYHASGDDETTFRIGLIPDFFGIVGGLVPEEGFKLRNCGVCGN